MFAEIITIGDELLLGQTIDTNSAWLGTELANIGINVYRKTAVKDSEDAILSILSETLVRSKLVIITGGLGPTKDDITKKCLCTFFNTTLKRNEAVYSHLTKIFEERGKDMLLLNEAQADVPENCEVLQNNFGTAPGMWFLHNDTIFISMPGVPAEMKDIFKTWAIPKILETLQLPLIINKTAVCLGIAESLLSSHLENFENSLPPHIQLAYLPAYNCIRLRLSGKSFEKGILQTEMETLYKELCVLVGDNLLATFDTEVFPFLVSKLLKSNTSLAVAESCTGGFINAELVKNAGISAIYQGGIMAYSNADKTRLLNVNPLIFETDGAVSENCALAMAKGVIKSFNTEIGISTTGIFGPSGGTDTKKIGTFYVAVVGKEKELVKKFYLHGTRTQMMERAINATAFALHLFLKN